MGINSEYILREDGSSNNDSSINDDSKTDEYNSNVATTNIDANDVSLYYKNGTRLNVELSDVNDNPLSNQNLEQKL